MLGMTGERFLGTTRSFRVNSARLSASSRDLLGSSPKSAAHSANLKAMATETAEIYRQAHITSLQIQFDAWCSQAIELNVVRSPEQQAVLETIKSSVTSMLCDEKGTFAAEDTKNAESINSPPSNESCSTKSVEGPTKLPSSTALVSSSPSSRKAASPSGRKRGSVASPTKSSRRSSMSTFIDRMRTHEIKKKHKKFDDSWLILPDSPFRLGWDMFLMVLIFYYAYFVPLRFGFSLEAPSIELETFFTSLFLFDIILNFNTAFMRRGQLVTDKKEIAKDYIKCWFFIDLAASLPFEWLYEDGSAGGGQSANKLGRLVKIFRFLRIFKLLRVLKLGRIVARVRQSTQVNPNLFLLMKTLGIMVFTWHIGACGYWYIVDIECHQDGVKTGEYYDDGDYWCPPSFILLSTNFNLQYGYAFFWGISVTTSAGYEIFPMTQAQIVYSAIVIIIGTALYCNILATCTSIVQGLSYSSSKKTAQLSCIFQYLKQQPNTKSLQRKIRTYYDFVWTDGMDHEVRSLVEGLPESLQVEVAQEMHTGLFEQISVFGDLDPLASFYLVKNWSRMYVMPGDDVMEEGVPNENLYLVFRGCLTMTTKVEFRTVRISTLRQGDYFGEEGLTSPAYTPATFTVTANETCELLVITKRVMTNMIKKFQLQDQIGKVLKLQTRRRLAQMRWKVSIAKVIAVARFKGVSGLESLKAGRNVAANKVVPHRLQEQSVPTQLEK